MTGDAPTEHTDPTWSPIRTHPGDRMQRTERTEHETYQYLRLAMVGALLTLAVSLLIEISQTGWCAQTSISAYYFTEVQAVLVGTLLVSGVSMVVISGRLVVEDAALNLAGLLAPIVAFAPTTELDSCVDRTAAQRDRGERRLAEAYLDGSVVNNIWAYLVVVTAALVLAGLVLLRSRKRCTTYTVTWSMSAVWLALVAYTFVAERELFIDKAHLASAVSLFVCIFVVVCANAAALAARDPAAQLEKARSRWERGWRHARFAVANRYGAIAALMAAGTLAIGSWRLSFGFDHWFFWIEILLIVLFAVFWVVQTFERRGHDHAQL